MEKKMESKRILIWVIAIFSILSSGSFSNAQNETDITNYEQAVFADNDKLLIALNYNKENTINIYDGNTNELTKTLKPEFDADAILDLDWSFNGQRIAGIYANSASSLNVFVWDIATETVVAAHDINFAQQLIWHPENPNTLLIHAGSRFFVWDITDNEHVIEYVSPWFGIESVTWSPDGNSIAFLGSGNLQVLDSQTFDVIFELEENLPITERTKFYFSLTFSANGSEIAAYDILNSEIEIWNITTRQMLRHFESFDTIIQHNEILRWADAGILGIDLRLETIVLYNPANGVFETLLENTSYVGFYLSRSNRTILLIPPLLQLDAPFLVAEHLPKPNDWHNK